MTAVPNLLHGDDVPLASVVTPELAAPEATVTHVASPPGVTTTLILGPDGGPVTGRRSGAIVRAPSVILRPRPDARFALPHATSEQLLDRLVLEAPLAGSAPRTAIVVAHPDDEAIGAGALMRDLPDVVIAHVTDGAPRRIEAAQRNGLGTREDYLRARREEVTEALALVGVPAERIRCLGFVDGEAALRLVEISYAVAGMLDELRPEVVLTHPYEGGHTDHDATAFAVHLACGVLRRDGVPAPIVLELTSYHNRGGRRVHADFLPFWPVPTRRVDLPPEAQMLKARMFRYFTTQQKVLSAFPLNVERFRIAPRYIFTVPPHEGPLDYERYCTTITGAEWRANAEKALHVLRAKRRISTRRAS
ncbi:MAG: PIG-L deacetylase family protein [Gemmatimonadaceae bacterium]